MKFDTASFLFGAMSALTIFGLVNLIVIISELPYAQLFRRIMNIEQIKQALEMKIEQMNQALEIAKALECDQGALTDFPLSVGDKCFIRTVTLYYTGQIKKICGQFVTLSSAAWIPDTGRFHDFLKTGKASEVEPFVDDVHIPLGSIIDLTIWNHKLPEDQK